MSDEELLKAFSEANDALDDYCTPTPIPVRTEEERKLARRYMMYRATLWLASAGGIEVERGKGSDE